MFRPLLNLAVFLAGLAVVGWIAAGYAGSNPLGLAVATLIGACYVAGALELHRYRQATATLERAVADLSVPPPSLADWLGRLHPGLRNAVRLRVEGERAPLPGAALAPYLVGLLVLLGMLGTLLGMMATLRGTGLALESATDLQAIRGSLAAPVKGLGFAFGTSIAGVSASAMLGLLSALCRRERLQAAQRLDAKIATVLRVHSPAHQREETFRLMQRQAEVMPALVERLQAMMAAIEQHDAAANERQLASQEAFHGRTEAAYQRLASSVERSLKESVSESARAAGAALRPAVEATMAGLAHEAAGLREAVAHAVQRQLDGLTAGFETSIAAVAATWNQALAEHRQAGEAQVRDLRGALDRFAETFGQRSAGLLDGVLVRLDAATAGVAEAWNQALARQDGANAQLAAQNQQALMAATADLERHAASLVQAVDRSHEELQTALAEQDRQRLETWSATLGSISATLGERWEQAAAEAANRQQAICDALARTAGDISAQTRTHAGETIAELSRLVQAAAHHQQALAAAAAGFEQHAASLVQVVDASHAQLQAALAEQDRQRLETWSATLGSISATLGERWEQAAADAAGRQQDICAALARTAEDIAAQTRTHAGETIAEISRLMQAASEAPRVAAEVVAELRQKLSDSMARDTAMLEERSRLMATLETLLQAVNHASGEQRTAIDALVATSADLLERVGTRFGDHVEAQTGKLDGVAAQVAIGAVEVASLGEAFGGAVQLFGKSNERLLARLQRVESALEKSLARSDEQLAYYVAQAKEVVDLSMLAQKQILEDLEQLAGQRAAAGAEAP